MNFAVLAGEWDSTVSAEHMREIADGLPDGTYLMLSGVAHFVEVEAHQRWADAVLTLPRRRRCWKAPPRAYCLAVAYDALLESVRLIASGQPATPLRLSRR